MENLRRFLSSSDVLFTSEAPNCAFGVFRGMILDQSNWLSAGPVPDDPSWKHSFGLTAFELRWCEQLGCAAEEPLTRELVE